MKTDYTRYRLSLMENIVFGMGYLVAAAVVCIIFYDSFLPLILMLPAGVYVRRLFEEYKRKRRQQELYFQFKDMVQALAASLSVGYSFENAFIAAHEELTRTYGKDALIVRELVVIMHEIRLHKNIEDVLADFGERSGIREIHNFSQLVVVAKRTGGNMPLRYNNDKQKKPLFSRGLSVCRLLFNSFSKLKIDENYKEKRRLFY